MNKQEFVNIVNYAIRRLVEEPAQERKFSDWLHRFDSIALLQYVGSTPKEKDNAQDDVKQCDSNLPTKAQDGDSENHEQSRGYDEYSEDGNAIAQ